MLGTLILNSSKIRIFTWHLTRCVDENIIACFQLSTGAGGGKILQLLFVEDSDNFELGTKR